MSFDGFCSRVEPIRFWSTPNRMQVLQNKHMIEQFKELVFVLALLLAWIKLPNRENPPSRKRRRLPSR